MSPLHSPTVLLHMYCKAMSHSCIVPDYFNNSEKPSCAGLSFHRLPLSDPVLLKEWLIKIRRENTSINHNSRVCSAHLKAGKRSSVNCIPTIFPWSKPSRKSPKKRPSP